jgi:rhamnulokinase
LAQRRFCDTKEWNSEGSSSLLLEQIVADLQESIAGDDTMDGTNAYLAFDFGAESGRAVLGRLRSGRLTMEEIHRFPNEPVRYNGEYHWDVARLWLEMQRTLALVASKETTQLDGIGVDAWGVDYALLGEEGALLENPYQYRDSRTDGVMDRVFSIISADEIFERTGIQFMQINTLFQLYAGHLKTPRLFDAARTFLTIPDLFNFWMTGEAACEYTIASTTQFSDPRTRGWASDLLDKLGLPSRILPRLIPPGTPIGPLREDVREQVRISKAPVIAPACHDTASAVAAVESAGESAYISSGTWSLLGTEVAEPVITPEAQRLNFTNEGGVCGTFRLLKNITGLWLLQCCRRAWQSSGQDSSYADLAESARSRPAFRSLVDPDHGSFLRPGNMPEAIARFCESTDQPVPADPPAFTRAVLESLALKYRITLELLERLSGKTFSEIHLVGGGAHNTLLNQFTADATGRRIVAGPIEATALGNIGVQMLATGGANSLAEVRRLIAESFPAQVFEPREPEKWQPALERFRQYCSTPKA